MPQIWLTYDELGAFARRDGSVARQAVIEHGWDRRRCHDGQTRVKLPPEATALYLSQSMPEAPAPRSRPVDEMVSMLRSAIAQTQRPEKQVLLLRAA